VVRIGQIKKQKKTYSRPKRPYDKARFAKEKVLSKSFGLRKKMHIWKAEEMLRNFRRRAKEILAKPDEKTQAELFSKLNNMGIKIDKIDDILEIKPENILSRRLQSVICSKGIAKTPGEARQLIAHGHILIDGRRAKYPGLIVTKDIEPLIELDAKMKNRALASEAKS